VFDNNKRIGQITYDQKFCQLLRANLEDPLVALLLALLPNVKELWLLEAPMVAKATLLPWHLPQHKLENLKRFAVCSQDRRAWSIAFFNDILKNNSLEVLEASCGGLLFRDNNQERPHPLHTLPLSLQARSIQLTTLHLPNCAMRRSEMQKLLLAAPHLKRFYYHHNSKYIGPKGCSASELITLLEPFATTLEDLYLDIVRFNISLEEEEEDHDFEGDEDDDEDESHLIDSLAYFTALKRLDTDVQVWRMLREMNVSDKYEPPEERIGDIDRWCLRLPSSLECLSLHTT
jgi:hypothetical protein